MKEWERFPVLDAGDAIGDAAPTIARSKARGAVVRRDDGFALVGWRDLARTLEHTPETPLGEIAAVAFPSHMVTGVIAQIDLGKLPHSWDRGGLMEATYYECGICGYRGVKPKNCHLNPCGLEQL